jgi:hypothetical protein
VSERARPLSSAQRGRLIGGVRWLHRSVGTLLGLLMASWFASGAVMTFARYPEWSERERVASAPPLAADVEVPAELQALVDAGALADGSRLRLAALEGQPTWQLLAADGPNRAWRAAAPWMLSPVSEARARREAERRLALTSDGVETVVAPDQWTVGRSEPADFPLRRVFFADPAATQVYVSSRTGEIVQHSTQRERLWCWLGAIPHWIYPAILRRQRALWRVSVLVLAGLGLALTSSGLAAGLWARRAQRQSLGSADSSPPMAAGNVYLRWHQRLGLWFGLFASSWLFSGALSLEPFHWSGPGPSALVLARLHAAPPANLAGLIQPVLDLCRSQLQVRELDIAALGGGLFAVCRNATRTRLVDLSTAPLRSSERLTAERMRELLATFPGAELGAYDAPDAYYYPTHSQPIALPYLRLDLHDESDSTFYLDPVQVSVVSHMTGRKRLERWLYHGLHSFDLPRFYSRRGLWRSALIGAMAVGVTLSALGLWMPLRRWRRRRRGRGSRS